MLDNAEWLTPLNYIEFLRDVGRHFSVNRMLTMDSVKLRLEREQELSFIEFNYMILQAYDFVELTRRYGCTLQMGGSDQWGNIVTGIDLGRRMGTPQLYALTCPLLTTSSGAKMGKTASGAVWLNEAQLAAYDYWQFWRNTEDADVARFLKLFTAAAAGRDRAARGARGAEINEAKKVLARRPPRSSTAATRRRPPPRRRARHSRKARSPPICRRSKCRGELAAGLGVLARSSRRASSPPTARRGVRSRAAASGSMTPP